MTFSKGKIVFFWVGLSLALAVAIAGVIANNNKVSIIALAIALGDTVLGGFSLRCPACGKSLIRIMKPWKDDCICPSCGVRIRFL